MQVSLTFLMLDFSDIKISFDIDLEKKAQNLEHNTYDDGNFFHIDTPVVNCQRLSFQDSGIASILVRWVLYGTHQILTEPSEIHNF